VGWEYTKSEDVGAILSGVVQDSITTGYKSLEELVVCGRVSKEIYDPDSLRLQCVQCLTSEPAMDPGLHEVRAHNDDYDVDAEDANFDTDFSTFESDSESSVDLSVGGDEDSKEQDLTPNEARTLNLREIVNQRPRINMDDDEEVEKYIAAAVKPEEREVFTFTLKDETDILTPLPCDAQLSKP
jgi:hypothetical protein